MPFMSEEKREALRKLQEKLAQIFTKPAKPTKKPLSNANTLRLIKASDEGESNSR